MLAAHLSSQGIDAWEEIGMESLDLFKPFIRCQAIFIKGQDMDVAITDMGNGYAIKTVFFPQFRNLGRHGSNLVQGNDKILGLEYGADDYMTKPFNILEVRARIRTVLRRAGGHVVQEQKIIRVHDMEVNLVKRTVTLGGEEVRLTAKEFDLLQMFITNRGRPFSRKEMLEAVWKYDDYTGDARTVDVHIRRLREKIERNPDEPEFIFTKWKVGYYFTDKD